MKFYILMTAADWVHPVVYSSPAAIKGWNVYQRVIEYDSDLSIPPRELRPIEIRKDHKKLKKELEAQLKSHEEDLRYLMTASNLEFATQFPKHRNRDALIQHRQQKVDKFRDFLTDFE